MRNLSNKLFYKTKDEEEAHRTNFLKAVRRAFNRGYDWIKNGAWHVALKHRSVVYRSNIPLYEFDDPILPEERIDRSLRLLKELNPAFADEIKKHIIKTSSHQLDTIQMPYAEEEVPESEIPSVLHRLFLANPNHRLFMDPMSAGNLRYVIRNGVRHLFFCDVEEAFDIGVAPDGRPRSPISDYRWHAKDYEATKHNGERGIVIGEGMREVYLQHWHIHSEFTSSVYMDALTYVREKLDEETLLKHPDWTHPLVLDHLHRKSLQNRFSRTYSGFDYTTDNSGLTPESLILLLKQLAFFYELPDALQRDEIRRQIYNQEVTHHLRKGIQWLAVCIKPRALSAPEYERVFANPNLAMIVAHICSSSSWSILDITERNTFVLALLEQPEKATDDFCSVIQFFDTLTGIKRLSLAEINAISQMNSAQLQTFNSIHFQRPDLSKTEFCEILLRGPIDRNNLLKLQTALSYLTQDCDAYRYLSEHPAYCSNDMVQVLETFHSIQGDHTLSATQIDYIRANMTTVKQLCVEIKETHYRARKKHADAPAKASTYLTTSEFTNILLNPGDADINLRRSKLFLLAGIRLGMNADTHTLKKSAANSILFYLSNPRSEQQLQVSLACVDRIFSKHQHPLKTRECTKKLARPYRWANPLISIARNYLYRSAGADFSRQVTRCRDDKHRTLNIPFFITSHWESWLKGKSPVQVATGCPLLERAYQAKLEEPESTTRTADSFRRYSAEAFAHPYTRLPTHEHTD